MRMAVSGVRSSWLTLATKSCCMLPSLYTEVQSWIEITVCSPSRTADTATVRSGHHSGSSSMVLLSPLALACSISSSTWGSASSFSSRSAPSSMGRSDRAWIAARFWATGLFWASSTTIPS